MRRYVWTNEEGVRTTIEAMIVAAGFRLRDGKFTETDTELVLLLPDDAVAPYWRWWDGEKWVDDRVDPRTDDHGWFDGRLCTHDEACTLVNELVADLEEDLQVALRREDEGAIELAQHNLQHHSTVPRRDPPSPAPGQTLKRGNGWWEPLAWEWHQPDSAIQRFERDMQIAPTSIGPA